MKKSISTQKILETFKKVIINNYSVPLKQKHLKSALILTIDQLVKPRTSEKDTLWLCANKSTEIADRVSNFQIHKIESMLDITLYENKVDPFICLLSAETEGYQGHEISDNSTSDTSDYLWDFFKLLQVPSPLRIFVARTTRFSRTEASSDRVILLQDKLEKFVDIYKETCLRNDDKVFTIVLPSSGKDYGMIECKGYLYLKKKMEIVKMVSAKW